MRIWAIADLHLGFSTGKWMDKFGDRWKDHHEKVERAWRERVAEGDIVLLPGDFSWAMRLSEVVTDFRWLGQLPGRKVLIKGNHDYWWSKSKKKMEEVLPPGTHALKKTAIVLDGVPIVGVRGCDLVPIGERTQEEVDAEIEREVRELKLSIAHLATLGETSRAPIALFHYPPFASGECESVFTRLVEEAGCRRALFGHLHSEWEWRRCFQGQFHGVNYQLVSCDFLGFTPILVEDVDWSRRRGRAGRELPEI